MPLVRPEHRERKELRHPRPRRPDRLAQSINGREKGARSSHRAAIDVPAIRGDDAHRIAIEADQADDLIGTGGERLSAIRSRIRDSSPPWRPTNRHASDRMGSDIGKSCAERIREIWPIRAHHVSLWVSMRRQIARTLADFPQFSEMSGKRETGWWSGMDSNYRYRFLNWQTTAFRATFAT